LSFFLDKKGPKNQDLQPILENVTSLHCPANRAVPLVDGMKVAGLAVRLANPPHMLLM
jgi:hypothetical protein